MDRVSVVKALLRDGLSGIALPWDKTTQRLVEVGNVEDPVLSPYSIDREGDSVYAVCAYGHWGAETREGWDPTSDCTNNCNLMFLVVIVEGDNLLTIHAPLLASRIILPEEESANERKHFLFDTGEGDLLLYSREGNYLGTTHKPYAQKLRLVQTNSNELPRLEYDEDGLGYWDQADPWFIRDI